MKIFYFIIMISFSLYANDSIVNSTDFLESCVAEYQTNDDVKLINSWYGKMVDMRKCDKSQLKEQLSDKVYVKNAILMLEFKMKTKECKEKLNELKSNFNELVLYMENSKSNMRCYDNIPNYWTHLVTHDIGSYKEASLDSEKSEILKKGMKLKIIAYDRSKKWGEFKYESNGQSLTTWIELSEVERINE